MTQTAESKSRLIAEAASDKKALDIVIMNMHDLTTTTDYFIVCSATTSTQVRAIADNIEEEMAKAGETFLHKEGYRNAEWILLDFGNCIVHVFTEEARRFYGLEDLWGEAPTEHYED
ncbi:MAG TPA: ribosome silencing factor [Candidatus Megamonas gallistercoris]|nr:ribosome silencing factor [Candidatus Megamonas gallistercoris]